MLINSQNPHLKLRDKLALELEALAELSSSETSETSLTAVIYL
jgi:hypothetical protein